MTDTKNLTEKIISIIYENLNCNCEFKAIFNVQLYGENSVIGGEIAIFENNSFSLIDDGKCVFEIFKEAEPFLRELQAIIGDNDEGNVYIKLHAYDLKNFNIYTYNDNDEKLEVENYLLWRFDELNMIQFPEDNFTIETLKKFNRIK